MLARTGNRTFLMRSINEKDPILFQTRWTLSYLRGPLTLPQISKLTEKKEPSPQSSSEDFQEKSSAKSQAKPAVPIGVPEFFVNSSNQQQPHYQPRVLGMAKLHFVDAKNKIDEWKEIVYVLPIEGNSQDVAWDQGKDIPNLKNLLQKDPVANGTFDELPGSLMQEKNYATLARNLAAALYQSATLEIFQTDHPPLTSTAGETEQEFRIRVLHDLREKRDSIVQKLKDKYAPKIAAATNKIQKAQEKLETKQQKAGSQKMQTLISFGSALLGAFFGKGVTKSTINQAGSTLKQASRMGQGSYSAAQAEEELNASQQQLHDLEAQLNEEIATAGTNESADTLSVSTISLHPKKSDVTVEKVGIVWWS
jgi:hypothetical protein